MSCKKVTPNFFRPEDGDAEMNGGESGDVGLHKENAAGRLEDSQEAQTAGNLWAGPLSYDLAFRPFFSGAGAAGPERLRAVFFKH